MEEEIGMIECSTLEDFVRLNHTDIQKLCDDWNEIKNYDDPNCEIVWVKKIVKTRNIGG